MPTVITESALTPAAPDVAAPVAETSAVVVTAGGSLIDEIVRDGARRMLAAALEAEVAAYVAAHVGELDERAGAARFKRGSSSNDPRRSPH